MGFLIIPNPQCCSVQSSSINLFFLDSLQVQRNGISIESIFEFLKTSFSVHWWPWLRCLTQTKLILSYEILHTADVNFSQNTLTHPKVT